MTATRHLLVPESMHAAAAAQATERGISMIGLLRQALEEWVSDIDQVRLTAAQADPGAPIAELPEWTRAELERLALDPSGRLLKMYLALLHEARWPVVALVKPILGLPQQAINARINEGRKLLASEKPDLLGRLPDVPDAPDAAQKMLTGEELVGLTVRVSSALLSLVSEKAELTNISPAEGMRAALQEAVGEDIPFTLPLDGPNGVR
ncbi:MAG: hypothetical protein L0H93_19125 [Nocardioides sp.]|nr:hypothetical protein [Nocardioides sp.]